MTNPQHGTHVIPSSQNRQLCYSHVLGTHLVGGHAEILASFQNLWSHFHEWVLPCAYLFKLEPCYHLSYASPWGQLGHTNCQQECQSFASPISKYSWESPRTVPVGLNHTTFSVTIVLSPLSAKSRPVWGLLARLRHSSIPLWAPVGQLSLQPVPLGSAGDLPNLPTSQTDPPAATLFPLAGHNCLQARDPLGLSPETASGAGLCSSLRPLMLPALPWGPAPLRWMLCVRGHAARLLRPPRASDFSGGQVHFFL